VTVRVAVYCPSLDDMSGVREVVRQSSAEMVARGNPVAVIARTRHDAVEVDGASGVTILRVRLDRAPHPGMGPCAYRRFVHRFPTAAGDVVRAVRGWRPDVVATHCSKFHAPYVFAMRARVRAPIVVHLHNAAVTADGPESPRLLARHPRGGAARTASPPSRRKSATSRTSSRGSVPARKTSSAGF